MILDIEEKTTEYYIVAVEQEEYDWVFRMNDGAIGREPWKTIDAWCEQVFGDHGMWGGPAGQWKRLGPKYYFGTNEERMMFILKWS